MRVAFPLSAAAISDAGADQRWWTQSFKSKDLVPNVSCITYCGRMILVLGCLMRRGFFGYRRRAALCLIPILWCTIRSSYSVSMESRSSDDMICGRRACPNNMKRPNKRGRHVSLEKLLIIVLSASPWRNEHLKGILSLASFTNAIVVHPFHNSSVFFSIRNMKFSAFITSLAIVGSEAFAPGIGGHARSSTGELYCRNVSARTLPNGGGE